MISLADLAAMLRTLPGLQDLDDTTLEPLPLDGIGHDHVRLWGRALLLRSPRFLAPGLSAAEQLDRQAVQFELLAPSGVTPGLAGRLAQQPGLPLGGLLVGEIAGRPPRLPEDMGALARCLATIHGLDIGETPQADAFDQARAALAADIPLFSGLAPAARSLLEGAWADLKRPSGPSSPLAVIAVDCHPGNFLIRPDGSACLVDVERARIGSPAMDLAHASLPSSTLWDPRVACRLTWAETQRFYADYAAAVGDVAALTPWFEPFRRLVFLRTCAWFARFRSALKSGGMGTEDLPVLRRAALGVRVEAMLAPEFIESVLAGGGDRVGP